MGTFIPFEASYYLNGHHYIERELLKGGMKYRKDDNAFLSVEDPEALQAATRRLSGELIRKRLEYWTFVLGPKFTRADRREAKLHRSYFVHQAEYCRNFVFKRNHPIRKLFERSCELGLWRLTGDRVIEIFGRRRPPATEREAADHAGANGQRPARVSGLLEARVRQAVREVLDVPAQRA
ncbi:MAG TPA: hypothetical protein VNN73_23100 [Blastocatellia bacterium]|nr:hypothetical protein [Blastocatellia bacterium]